MRQGNPNVAYRQGGHALEAFTKRRSFITWRVMQEPTRGVVFGEALSVVSEYFKVSLVKASRHIRPAESHALYATIRETVSRGTDALDYNADGM